MKINSRSKGKRGELRAVHWLREHIWPGAHRSASQGAGGDVAPDVDGTTLWIEVKSGANPHVWKAVEQAIEDAAGRRPPVVIAYRTHGRAVMVIPLDTLVDTIVKLYDMITEFCGGEK
jgi:hypothetical protein